MKTAELRREFANKYSEKIRTELTTYNPDYVHFLEDKIVKLVNITDVNNNEAFSEVTVCDHKRLKLDTPANSPYALGNVKRK